MELPRTAPSADKRVNLMAALHINVSIIQAYPINSEENQ